MRLAVILPPGKFARLRAALDTIDLIERVAVHPGDEGCSITDADVIVIDPLQETRLSLLPLGWIGHNRGKTVVYAGTSPTGMRAAMALVQQGVVSVVLSGYDDSSTELRHCIESAYSHSLANRAVERLASELSQLPIALRRVTRNAVVRPLPHATSEALCRESGMPRRSCDRWAREAGFHSLGRLLRAARALHVVSLLRGSDTTITAVSEHLGLGSSKGVSALSRDVFGVAPSELRVLSDDDILHRFATFARVTAG